MTDLLWLIPVLPLLGALLNGVFLKGRLSKGVVAAVACGSVVIAILIAGGAVWGWAGSGDAAVEQSVYSWIPAGLMAIGEHGAGEAQPLAFEMGFRLDALSAVMLFVVLIVGFLIHVYSVGYMAHEGGFQRYFAYLNLFMGAMLLLVLGNNYLVMFVGWEGVGLCSYLLIGFYFDQEFPPYAGRKAFIVNRIGDFAFLVGLFALVSRFGTLTYGELFDQVAHHPEAATEPYLLGLSFAGFVTLCLFVGAMGKSAQIPLYVWLPDAMAGPTPVSALIHAATMVTAGVYMMARTNVLYELAPEIGMFVAVVGAVTAIFAATIGLAQTDIKKVLAYSTVSQLGYMFLAAGCGAYGVAVFHLGTHAFFKALLFLGSGSVIHAMSGEQDIRKMGGLRKVLPTTYWTFLVGTLAIAGVPGLAGFFSKDQILAAAWGQSKLLWVVGLITAGLTACYMFRLVFLTFSGEFRGTEEQRSHLHESPASMTVPLTLLAIGSIFAGYLGLPRLGEWNWNWLEKFMAPVWVDLHHGADHGHHASLTTELVLMGASVLVAGLGIWIAWRIWGKGGTEAGEVWARRSPALHRLLVNKYYVDELYDAAVVRPLASLASAFKRIVDGLVIEGAVHTLPFLARMAGDLGRFSTTGNVRNYALYFFAGVLLLLWWLLG